MTVMQVQEHRLITALQTLALNVRQSTAEMAARIYIFSASIHVFYALIKNLHKNRLRKTHRYHSTECHWQQPGPHKDKVFQFKTNIVFRIG